jgi:hypothetical protein
MKRAFLIIVGALALAGFLIPDIAWPKACIAEETSAAAPAAEAASTAQAETRSVPEQGFAETSDGPSQGTKNEEASVQNNQGSTEAVSEHHDTSAADENASPANEN